MGKDEKEMKECTFIPKINKKIFPRTESCQFNYTTFKKTNDFEEVTFKPKITNL
jgi:hypothetical protein